LKAVEVLVLAAGIAEEKVGDKSFSQERRYFNSVGGVRG